ncbi:GFA family protein [Variovorax sp. KK3]|uniref:GFA family protein n=1 Tax=Variovorax sp. KK3 TaxID=1855728 RepID=UPI00097BBADD|nr:GFA family protein [Variovorax sp. KK3]
MQQQDNEEGTPFKGGCACGAIRFEIADAPIAMNDCQCRDCQRRSGTGHGSYISFGSRAKLTLTGEAKEWSVTGSGGLVKQHAFCPACGSPVYLSFPAMPDVFVVHAGSLDDPSRYQPQHVTYTIRGHAWDAIDPALMRYERMPPGQG